MGRFSDVVWCDLSITLAISRLLRRVSFFFINYFFGFCVILTVAGKVGIEYFTKELLFGAYLIPGRNAPLSLPSPTAFHPSHPYSFSSKFTGKGVPPGIM